MTLLALAVIAAIVGVLVIVVAKLTLVGILVIAVALGLALAVFLLRGRRGTRAPY